MSTSTSPVDSSFGAEILDRLNSVEKENERLQSRLESHEDRIDNLEAENERLRQQVSEDRNSTTAKPDTQQESNSTVSTLTDIEIGNVPVGVLLSKALENAKDAQREVASIKEGDTQDDRHQEPENELTPIERVLEDPESSGVRITESVSRALTILGNFGEWSKKVPAGRSIKDGLRELLSTAEETSLQWNQVYRACYKLEELSRGAFRFRDGRSGKILVQERALTTVVSGER